MLLRTPIAQDLRINANGIARDESGAWQALPQQTGSSREPPVLMVLAGDTKGLQEKLT